MATVRIHRLLASSSPASHSSAAAASVLGGRAGVAAASAAARGCGWSTVPARQYRMRFRGFSHDFPAPRDFRVEPAIPGDFPPPRTAPALRVPRVTGVPRHATPLRRRANQQVVLKAGMDDPKRQSFEREVNLPDPHASRPWDVRQAMDKWTFMANYEYSVRRALEWKLENENDRVKLLGPYAVQFPDPPSPVQVLRFRTHKTYGIVGPDPKELRVELEVPCSELRARMSRDGFKKLLKLVDETRYDAEADVIRLTTAKFLTQQQSKAYLRNLLTRLIDEAEFGHDRLADIPLVVKHRLKRHPPFPEEWKQRLAAAPRATPGDSEQASDIPLASSQ